MLKVQFTLRDSQLTQKPPNHFPMGDIGWHDMMQGMMRAERLIGNLDAVLGRGGHALAALWASGRIMNWNTSDIISNVTNHRDYAIEATNVNPLNATDLMPWKKNYARRGGPKRYNRGRYNRPYYGRYRRRPTYRRRYKRRYY